MKEKLEEFFKKIELIHIVILVVLVVGIIFMLYRATSTRLKKFSKEIKEETIIEEQCFYEIKPLVRDGKNTILCQLNKEYFETEPYHNYVTGEGENFKIDYKILVKLEDKYYEVKTIKTAEDEENIYFSACIEDKRINEQSEIGLYDNNRKKLFKY